VQELTSRNQRQQRAAQCQTAQSNLAKQPTISLTSFRPNRDILDMDSQASLSDFPTFRELLLHCLKHHDTGDSKQALALIDEYLADARADRPADAFWSEYNVQQALGFRVAFTEKAEPASAQAAEERHFEFCQRQLKYWLSAAADSSARLAIARFKEGEINSGRAATEEALRLSGSLGVLSVTVANAAEAARKTSHS
jgi:hypothetical protein